MVPRPGRVPFDPATATIETARQIAFARLRADRDWRSLDKSGDGFSPFVEYSGLPGRDGRWKLTVLAIEVFWQLVAEGVLSPGGDYSNPDLPWFHITDYGREVLALPAPQPPLAPIPQSWLMWRKALRRFRKGNLVASTVMLGIAAERVFLLLCESMASALADPGEKVAFARLMKSMAMKPKLDWVHEKIQKIQKARPAGFPDNATIMTMAIYDLLRRQRNDLGHPREDPPAVKRADAFVNLQIFPRYFELAEEVRSFLKANKV